jgi:hypothetical protein
MFSSGGISATANTGTSRKTTSHAILRTIRHIGVTLVVCAGFAVPAGIEWRLFGVDEVDSV